MTAKRTPFSYNVGTVYHGFLTGNFYHYTLTISFCLQVSMAIWRRIDTWTFCITVIVSVLFNSWIIKNDPKQMTLSLSFDIIIWYPLFRVSDMKTDDWEYWVVNSHSHRAFFCSLRPGDGGGGDFLIEMPVKKPVVNCSLIIEKGVSLAVIVKMILKLFHFKVRWGVSPLQGVLKVRSDFFFT